MHPALLVGAGFLLGTAGVKAIKSKPAHKLAVKGIACGMKVRDSITTMVDEARMQLDDMVAEAGYENAMAECECDNTAVVEEEIIVEEDAEDVPAKAPARSPRKAAAKTPKKA